MGYYFNRLTNKYRKEIRTINSLEVGQRKIILLAGFGFIIIMGILANHYIVGKKTRAMDVKIIAISSKIKQHENDIAEQENIIKNKKNKQRLVINKQLDRKIEYLAGDIKAKQRKTVSSLDVIKKFKKVLSYYKKIKLQSFETYKIASKSRKIEPGIKYAVINKNVSGQLGDQAVNQDDNSKKFYKISLEGDYMSIYNFLKKIDSLNMKLYWVSLNYRVKSVPIGVVDIDFYHLSE